MKVFSRFLVLFEREFAWLKLNIGLKLLRTTLVSDLYCNVRKAGQSCHTDLGAGLASVAQFIGQLPISIDVAPFCLCFVDQFCLPRIIKRALT
jgi:hypothetical protein